jgi:hypothetical protein
MADDKWIRHAYPLQQVFIKLQGTRHSARNDLLVQLEEVAARIRQGDLTGTSHDDDFGYEFQVDPASPGPSLFDEPAGHQ